MTAPFARVTCRLRDRRSDPLPSVWKISLADNPVNNEIRMHNLSIRQVSVTTRV
ncbi:MAG: hypothetical protein IID36_06340 [Planctomycetes bacterium]|nr:hypothetical protein [Planctomycetota bacterium]